MTYSHRPHSPICEEKRIDVAKIAVVCLVTCCILCDNKGEDLRTEQFSFMPLFSAKGNKLHRADVHVVHPPIPHPRFLTEVDHQATWRLFLKSAVAINVSVTFVALAYKLFDSFVSGTVSQAVAHYPYWFTFDEKSLSNVLIFRPLLFPQTRTLA